jgi:uncharacterized membrane protein
MDGRFYPYADHGPHLLGWLVFAALLALLVVGVLALLGRTGRPRVIPAGARQEPASDALTVLRLRYARGEISRDEFLQASEDLGLPPPAGA